MTIQICIVKKPMNALQLVIEDLALWSYPILYALLDSPKIVLSRIFNQPILA